MRDFDHENLFERWLDEERVARYAHELRNDFNPYVHETFKDFCERMKAVSDTVTGDAEVLPASEKRDEEDAHGGTA